MAASANHARRPTRLTTDQSETTGSAKDSDSAGKMDKVSVLLHEYGHVLGLELSAEAGDSMATTLTPVQHRVAVDQARAAGDGCCTAIRRRAALTIQPP